MRLTKNRQLIYDLLEKESSPLSAQSIFEIIKNEMDKATVYRALQFLEDEKLVDSFTFECKDNGIIKYFTNLGTIHTHFFHCENCHVFLPIESCQINHLQKLADKHGFKITSHTVYYRGICNNCLNN
jgi:Fur family ferric uptake transcriptional regulator